MLTKSSMNIDAKDQMLQYEVTSFCLASYIIATQQ